MTSILCIGHGKSGTTFLHDVFRDRTDIPVPPPKETSYFHREDVSLEGYGQYFGLTAEQMASPDYLTFEACPTYISAIGPGMMDIAYKRIAETVPNPCIVIALRHPARRLVSNYAHVLYEAAQHGFPGSLARKAGVPFYVDDYPHAPGLKDCVVNNLFDMSIEETLEKTNMITSYYSHSYRLALKHFGADRIFFFHLEQDTKDLPGFINRMSDFFGLSFPFDPAPMPRTLESRGAPYYRYGGETGCMVEIEGTPCTLKPKQLLVVCSLPSLLLDDVSEAEYHRMEAIRSKWNRHISASQMQEIYTKYLKEDFEDFLALADQHYHDKASLEPYRNLAFTDRSIEDARFEGRVAEIFRSGRNPADI